MRNYFPANQQIAILKKICWLNDFFHQCFLPMTRKVFDLAKNKDFEETSMTESVSNATFILFFPFFFYLTTYNGCWPWDSVPTTIFQQVWLTFEDLPYKFFNTWGWNYPNINPINPFKLDLRQKSAILRTFTLNKQKRKLSYF